MIRPYCAQLGTATSPLSHGNSIRRIPRLRLILCFVFLFVLAGLAAAQSSRPRSAGQPAGAPGRPPRIYYTVGAKNRLAIQNGEAHPKAGNSKASSTLNEPVINEPDGNESSTSSGEPADPLYYGGPVISDVQVVVVYWGQNVDPVVTTGIPGYFTAITNSNFLDMLSEYSTNGVTPVGGGTAGNEFIGRGSLTAEYTIAPSIGNNGGDLDDSQIQTELLAQINAGHLPAPTTDSNGYDTTLYMIYFPPGLTITLDGFSSCVEFCAYHGTVLQNNLFVPYGVFPDQGPTEACSTECAAGSELQDLTTISSHELAESITDAAGGVAYQYAYPLGWYDVTWGEVGDICNASGNPQNQALLPGGVYTVQKIWSNLQQDCVTAPPTFTLSAPANAMSNVPLTVTLSVQSSTGVALAPPYTGTIAFTSSGSAGLPANYTFTSADNNSHTFSNAITPRSAGSQTFTVTDTLAGGFTGSAQVTVTNNVDGYFTVSGPTSASSGVPFNFTITALSGSGSLNSSYSGTVHFTSSDPQATLPADATLANGVGTLPATLRTAGVQTILAADTANSGIAGLSNNIPVLPGPAARLAVSAPAAAVLNTPFTFTVNALDLAGNVSLGYTGTVHFTSSDTSATLPANSTLTSGTRTFTATMATLGTQTITATDTLSGAITGISGNIAAGGPDLIVSSFSVLTTNPVSGGSLTFTDTVANQGNVNAGNTLTGFYLSTDGKTLGTLFGYNEVFALAAGANSGPATLTLTLPQNLNGTYYLMACANYNDAVVETNYNNDCAASSPMQVAGPDLTESGVSVTGTFSSGGTIQVSDTVNDSGGFAPVSTTWFYLAASAASQNGTYLGLRSVPSLNPGASSTATTQLTLPGNVVGPYYIVACANSGYLTITESNTANNCTASSAINIPSADLAQTAVTVTGSLVSGGAIQVTDTVSDAVNTAPGSTTWFYLAGSATAQSGTYLGNRTVPSLTAGSTNTATTPLTLPVGVGGTFYIVACANSSSSGFTETNMANNCAGSAAITVASADLAESGVSVTGTFASGGTIQVTDTATDSVGTAPASTTWFYLAGSATAQGGTYLGNRGVPSLIPGAGSSATTTLTLPAGVAGTYYIVACANSSYSGFTETNMANNCAGSAAIAVASADLAESGVSATGTFASGGTIQVADTVTDSLGTAPGSTTWFYLAGSATAQGGTYLGNRSVPSLAPGASSSATTTLTLPTGISGTYYVVACANSSYTGFTETNKANNCAGSKAITMAPADLSESGVSITGNFTSGGAIQVTETATDAVTTAPPSTTYFYLSTLATAQSGTYLGSRGVPSLTAGSTSAATTTLTLPTGIAGPYYIIACANSGGSMFTETNRANNCSSGAFTVIGPVLAESGVSVTGNFVNGGTIQVTETVTDTVAPVPASTTQFYVASSVATAKTSGSYIGSRGVPTLAVNGTSTATTTMTLPMGFPKNTYYIVACANGNNAVPEESTSSNCSGVPIVF
jgi:hypothetical protein